MYARGPWPQYTTIGSAGEVGISDRRAGKVQNGICRAPGTWPFANSRRDRTSSMVGAVPASIWASRVVAVMCVMSGPVRLFQLQPRRIRDSATEGQRVGSGRWHLIDVMN